jgi:MFS family permease
LEGRATVMNPLRDPRALRLLSANFLFSVGSGVSMIAVPWGIVSLPNGDRLYGQVMLWTTLILIALLPAAGLMIDRMSRKRILIGAQLLGAFCVGACTLLTFITGEAGFWTLVAVYTIAFTVYTLYYPALFAFTQQVFTREEYARLAGASEVQGQTASVVAGGLAAALLGIVSIEWILLFDTLAYAAAIVLLAGIPYSPTHLAAAGVKRPGFWKGLGEAVRFLEERRTLAVLLLCSMLPFVGVMVANYLWPVFVSRTLEAGPRVFASGEIAFAVGAIGAGLVAQRIVAARGAFFALALTVATYTLAFVTMTAFPHTLVFLATMVFVGFGNAGSRVARNLVLFHAVPNALMGRVNSFYSIVDRSLRAMLIAAAAGGMAEFGPAPGLVLLCILGAAALLGIVASRSAAKA